MKKVFLGLLFCICLIVSMFHPVFAQDGKKWVEIKPIYKKAILKMTRISVSDWPEDYLGQVKTLSEKEEIIRLWILAVDGSYSDCIIPGLGMYMRLYDQAIKSAKTDAKRKVLFVSEVNGLIKIFKTLDTQIKVYVDFEKSTPKYAGKRRGFFSTQVGWQKGDRSYDQYHFLELKYLEEILRKNSVPTELSVKHYGKLLKSFPDRLADARSYM